VGIAENTAGLAGFLALTMLLGRSADSALWGYFAGIVAGLGLGVFLARDILQGIWRAPKVNREIFSGLLTGLRGQLGNVAAFFNYRFDVFIVNYYLDPAQVGLYALGVVISEGLWQIPQAAALGLFPRTARTVGEDAAEFTCLILRHVFAISCISALALALASPIAVPLLFGAQFSPSVRVIWWILPGTIAISMGKVAASHLAGRGKTGRNSVFGAIALVVTLALDLLLIPRIGISGAAIASSASYILNGGLLLIALRKELRASWPAMFVPSRTELLRYKSVAASALAWSKIRIAQL
jgi:O-antigen/teichoic acid export membrane protein